jgi:hypothetical protein
MTRPLRPLLSPLLLQVLPAASLGRMSGQTKLPDISKVLDLVTHDNCFSNGNERIGLLEIRNTEWAIWKTDI